MGKRILSGFVYYFGALASLAAAAPAPKPVNPPEIRALLKPAVFKRVVENREAMTHANLGDAPPPLAAPLKRYSFYAAMQVNAGQAQTRDILTRYELYAKMIPYIDKAEFHPQSKTLHIEGGILGFKLISNVQFEERGDRWIRYRIVSGHFTGLEGDIFFEPEKDRGAPSTLVYLQGGLNGREWPPTFVIERGAEIVFGFTARRMRDYIESQKKSAMTPAPQSPAEGAAPHGAQDPGVPQPRSHL